MADPLSVTLSTVAVITAAVQSTRSLYDTVQRLRDRDKTLRRLRDELESLINILDLLTQVYETGTSMLALLKGPISRYSQICRDFEQSIEVFSTKSRKGLRDWAKMEFMRGDINDFINIIAGYKSIISVGLGTITMSNYEVSAGVLQEYNELVQDTVYNLEVHLQRIHEKLARLAVEDTTTSGTSTDLKDERIVTEQCLRVCDDARSYIESLANQESPLLEEPCQSASEDNQQSCFEAQSQTRQALDRSRESFAEITGHLRERLATLVKNGLIKNDSERRQLQEEISISKQCLEVCKVAREASYQKTYKVGEVIADGDSDPVVVCTLSDLFNVKKALSRDRSAQLRDSISGETPAYMADKRYDRRFGDSGPIQADATRSPSAFKIEKSQYDIPPPGINNEQLVGLKNETSEFRDRYGRGFKLTPRSRLSLDNHTVSRFTSNWELPSILANAPDKMRSLLGQITLTRTKDNVKATTCERYIRDRFGDSGITVMGHVVKAILSPLKHYECDNITIEATDDRINVSFIDDGDYRDLLLWLCLTFRQPLPGSVCYSTGTDEEIFVLKPLSPVQKRVDNCWYELFESAIIALDPKTQVGVTNMLEVDFNVLIQLAAVEYPVTVDAGIVLMGYSTALIPIQQVNDETILWHLETAKHGSQFKTTELEAIKSTWLKRPRLEYLQSHKALVGWCPEAVTLLGTENMNKSVKWSNAKLKQSSWHWKGANLQLVAQSAAPLQIGAQVGFSFDQTINTLRFSPLKNYLKCLNSASIEQIVLYDVSEHRAWLVPLICVLHQMLLVYWNNVPEEFRKADIPLAQPTSDGALACLVALRDSNGVIEASESEQLTVRDLILGFSINLSKTSLQPPRRAEIYGYEFMDIIMDSTKTELKRKHINKEGLAWASLLNEVNCLFCSCLGDAIIGLRADTANSPCNQLPLGLDWMAASVRSIDVLNRKQGGDGVGGLRQLSSQHFWLLKGAPFQRCQHGNDNAVSCWRTNSVLQEMQTQKYARTIAKQEAESFPNGAIVFGRGRTLS